MSAQHTPGVVTLENESVIAFRLRIWNAAIEAAALVVEPIPHVNEERTCGEVAAAIRALAITKATP